MVFRKVKYVIDSCYPQLVTNNKSIATNKKLKHEDNLGIETVDWTSFENDSSIRYSNLIIHMKLFILLVNSVNYEQWMEILKKRVEDSHNLNNKNDKIWLFANDNPLNGIIGFINCLRKESNGQRIRSLFLADDNNTNYD